MFLCEPRLTESAIGNLELTTHTAKDGVQFLYGMMGWCGGGGGERFRLASVWWFSYYILRVQKPLSHYSDLASPEVQNTYSHLGAYFTFTMPFTFSFAEYENMIYVYGFSDGNSVHAVAEYQKRFPNRTTRAISHLISTRTVYFMHQR
jgi:hypothetical protein